MPEISGLPYPLINKIRRAKGIDFAIFAASLPTALKNYIRWQGLCCQTFGAKKASI